MSQFKGILTDHYQQRILPRGSTIWDGMKEFKKMRQEREAILLRGLAQCVLPEPAAAASLGKLLQANPTSYLADPEGLGPSNLCLNKPCRWMLYTSILRSTGLKISNLKEKCWVWRTSSSSVWLTVDWVRTAVKMEDENIGQKARCIMWPLVECVLIN